MNTQENQLSGFASFRQFYPYYLAEHSDAVCRRLHVVGTGFVISLFVTTIVTLQPLFLLFMPVVGYGFAWVGHFFFEHNKPATFKHPFYSLIGDFVMFRDVLTGRIAW